MTQPLPPPGSPVAHSTLASVELAFAAGAVFFVPFNLLRFEFVYFTLGDLLLVMSLAVRLHRGDVRPSLLRSGTMLWIGGLLLMSAGFMASAILYGAVDRGLIVTLQYLFAYLMLPAVLIGRPWRETILLVKVFCFSMFVICVFGIYLIHIDGEKNTRFVSGNGRLRSFLERENALAALIGMTIPLMLWLADIRSIRKVTAVVGCITLFYGTMLTGSNTGVVAFVIAVVAYVLFAMPLRRVLVVVPLGVAAVYAMLTFGRDYLPAVFQDRVLSALEAGSIEEAGTFEYRYALILESLQFARSSLGLGFGPDQYQYASFFQDPVHNTYLLIWTEGGLGALIGFVATIMGAYLAVITAAIGREGKTYVAPALCVLTTFTLLVNAAPHVYARFWITPLVLAMGIAIAFLDYGPLVRRRLRVLAPRPVAGVAEHAFASPPLAPDDPKGSSVPAR